MSTLFLRTLREDPADADVDSAKLLQRAGYIRKAAPGIWTWLPLGLSVLNKIEEIIREEINGIGAQEVHFPALLPREPYEATHRWEEYGDNIFRLKDRHESDYLLAPTHEEMFTLLVKDMYSSYKDLPVTLYQIQTKYRDEFRPRAGLIRGREFIMKDAYSFTVDEEGMRQASSGSPAFQRVRMAINRNDLGMAEQLLRQMDDHNGEWNFLMGIICYRRGWVDEARRYYQTACQMDPGNLEYRQTLNYVENNREGYRPEGYDVYSTGCGGDNLCGRLACFYLMCNLCSFGGMRFFCC